MAIITADIANLGKYATGEFCNTTLEFPTSTQQVQSALKTIGVDGLRYEEIMVCEYTSKVDGLAQLLTPYASIDELNYLACRLEALSPDEQIKFSAVLQHGEFDGEPHDLINLTYNLDCYDFYPGVDSYEEYGRYLVENEFEFSLPEKAVDYFDYAAYGEDTTINEGGVLTAWGYVLNNREPFREFFDGTVPKEYRVFRYPMQTKVRPVPKTATDKDLIK